CQPLSLYNPAILLRRAEGNQGQQQQISTSPKYRKIKSGFDPRTCPCESSARDSAGKSNGFLIQEGFLRAFSQACTVFLTLGVWGTLDSRSVAQNCGALQSKAFQTVE